VVTASRACWLPALETLWPCLGRRLPAEQLNEAIVDTIAFSSFD
jgi:hypothetical protein